MFRTLTTFALATLIATPSIACQRSGMDELFYGFIANGERSYAEPVPVGLPDVGYTNARGEQKSLSDNLGKPMIVTLWHPRCPGCKVDLPALNTFLESPDIDETQFVQISVEQLHEGQRNYTQDDVQRFLDSKKYGKIDGNIDIGNKLFKASCMVATPTHLMVNSEGKVTDVLFGAFPWPDSPFADDIRTYLTSK